MKARKGTDRIGRGADQEKLTLFLFSCFLLFRVFVVLFILLIQSSIFGYLWY